MSQPNYVKLSTELRKRSLRDRIRHVSLSMLSIYQSASGEMLTGLKRHRVHFLYLHHLFEDEEAGFRKLLLTLSTQNRFINYSEAVRRVQKGPIDDSYLCISFDDGFKNNLRAADILNEFGIKACFFVCPDFVGETNYNKIQELTRERFHIPPVEFMNWDELSMLKREGHEIGSQTNSHRRMNHLDPQELVDEVAGSFETLNSKLGDVLHFAWPYGRFAEFSAEASKCVFDAGYRSCASAIRGCHTLQADNARTPVCIRREHVIASWPLPHVLYFLARSSKQANVSQNDWPNSWQASIAGALD